MVFGCFKKQSVDRSPLGFTSSLVAERVTANASYEEATENRMCQKVYYLEEKKKYIDIPSPTPPFGKTCQVFPCLLLLGIVSKFPLLSLTRSLDKGRGLVAEQSSAPWWSQSKL